MNFNSWRGLKLVDKYNLSTKPDKNPQKGLRLFANGALYPSQEVVDRYNLEYQAQDASDPGNAIDIVDSTQWAPTAQLEPAILVAFVNRKEPKTDLFSRTVHDENNAPKNSVMNGTQADDLLDRCKELGYFSVNGIELKFIDLTIVESNPITTEDGIYYLPKTIARGKRKGEPTYTRRENIQLYLLVPTNFLTIEANEERSEEHPKAVHVES